MRAVLAVTERNRRAGVFGLLALCLWTAGGVPVVAGAGSGAVQEGGGAGQARRGAGGDGILGREAFEHLPIVAVNVQGNLKIETDAILDAIRARPGTTYTTERIRRDVKALFALGLFRDIQVDAGRRDDGVVLTFIVVEKPSIRTVRVEGNDKLEKEDIQEVITLKLYAILNESDVQENVLLIKDLYAEKGYYLAEVEPEIVPISENEVEVIFHIDEHAKVLVKKIYFVGNEKIPASEFSRYLETKEAGFLGFLGSSGTFNEDQLENDALVIMAYYNEKGYVQANVDPPHAFLSPDKRSIYVTFRIREGERYKMGEIHVTGDLIAPEEDLLALLATKTGDWFTRSTLGEDIQTLTDYYSDRGHAFANVIPIPDIDDQSHTVDITFEVAKGDLVTLNRIAISGNTVTWDKAIRREVLINEGEQYRGSAMKEGKRRLERLGYFEEVKISTPKAGNNALDMDIDVTEKATGTFNIGAGFSSFESFIFNANIAKQNFLGLGFVMSAAAQVSSRRRQFNLNFFDPYFLDTRWTFRIDGYNIDQNYYLAEFRRGMDVGLGHYVGRSDDARFSLKYTFENVGLKDLSESWRRYYGGELFRGGDVSSLEASFIYDRRNNRITPTSGFLLSASSELAGGFSIGGGHLLSLFGGDFNFHRHQFNFRLYVPLYRKVEDLLVFRWNTTIGSVWSTDGRLIPLLQRYRAGGINSVRGYNILSLGPTLRVTDNDEPSHKDQPLVVGGYQILTVNVELEFALLRQAGIRGVVFFDAGNAFDIFGTDELNGVPNGVLSDSFPRLSTGFGVRWFSPMGPLRFEWGFPLTRREGERNQVFEFTIGSFF